MLNLNDYYLRKKEHSELSPGMILYHKSMKPEAKLEEMYEVVEPARFAVNPDASYQELFFHDFSGPEKMYPSMMKPARKALWDRRNAEMQELVDMRKKAKRKVHTEFMLTNPDLPLVQDLHKTDYGRELMAEYSRSQQLQSESGTGANVFDEQERDSVNMSAVKKFETIPFMISNMNEPFSQLEIERDNNGRIVKKGFDLYPATIEYRYEYDTGGRLNKVLCERNTAERYQYGKSGERITSETMQTKPQLYKYNEHLQLMEAEKIKYFYDNNGRLVLKDELGKITRYAYLESGSLREVLLPDGKRVEYDYNAEGLRVAKSVGGTRVETYLWDGLTTLIAVADGEGSDPKIFSYNEEGDPVSMTRGEKTYLFATDQVGTIFMVADDQGNELKRIICDSFGNLIVDTNEKFDTCLGFAAGLVDKDTGLVHFGYREYDPTIGRFITPDPIGFAGGDVDVYGYCLDDPINFVDRDGLKGKSEESKYEKSSKKY